MRKKKGWHTSIWQENEKKGEKKNKEKRKMQATERCDLSCDQRTPLLCLPPIQQSCKTHWKSNSWVFCSPSLVFDPGDTYVRTYTHTHTHTHTITRRGKQRNSLLSTEKPVKTPPSPSSNFYSSQLNWFIQHSFMFVSYRSINLLRHSPGVNYPIQYHLYYYSYH